MIEALVQTCDGGRRTRRYKTPESARKALSKWAPFELCGDAAIGNGGLLTVRIFGADIREVFAEAAEIEEVFAEE